MSEKLEAFLAEVRTIPRYIAALAVDPRRIDEFEKVERALLAVDRLANDDPAIIYIFDKIQDVIGGTGLSLKERLLEVGKLLMQGNGGKGDGDIYSVEGR